MQRVWPGILAICVGGVSTWAAFLAYAANQERVSSSAMRRVLGELRESEDVRAILGDAVRPEPKWYLNGSTWVYGSVRVINRGEALIHSYLCLSGQDATGKH